MTSVNAELERDTQNWHLRVYRSQLLLHPAGRKGGRERKIEIKERGGTKGGGKENHESVFTIEKKMKTLRYQGVPERAKEAGTWVHQHSSRTRTEPPLFWSKVFLLQAEVWAGEFTQGRTMVLNHF